MNIYYWPSCASFRRRYKCGSTSNDQTHGTVRATKESCSAAVLAEQEDLASQLSPETKFDKVLNLVGNKVLLESTSLTRTSGRMLQAGWMGGLAPVADFNPMISTEPGVHFSSKVLRSPEFPLSVIPLQKQLPRLRVMCGTRGRRLYLQEMISAALTRCWIRTMLAEILLLRIIRCNSERMKLSEDLKN